MKILINYANIGYDNARAKQKETAYTLGKFDNVIEYNFEHIDEEFKSKHSKIFSEKRGAGFWLWKPYIILKTLKAMNSDDILMYCDAAMSFVSCIDPYIKALEGKSFLVFQNSWHKEHTFTKADILTHFDVLSNKSITSTFQLDASHSLWTKAAIPFVEEWLDLCTNYQYISDAPSIVANLPQFKQNRHDQSILSILAKVRAPSQIEFVASQFDGNLRKNLPELLDHHRNRN